MSLNGVGKACDRYNPYDVPNSISLKISRMYNINHECFVKYVAAHNFVQL